MVGCRNAVCRRPSDNDLDVGVLEELPDVTPVLTYVKMTYHIHMKSSNYEDIRNLREPYHSQTANAGSRQLSLEIRDLIRQQKPRDSTSRSLCTSRAMEGLLRVSQECRKWGISFSIRVHPKAYAIPSYLSTLAVVAAVAAAPSHLAWTSLVGGAGESPHSVHLYIMLEVVGRMESLCGWGGEFVTCVPFSSHDCA